MKTFTKVGKAVVTGIMLSAVLMTTACGNTTQGPSAAPTSPTVSQSAPATATAKPLSKAATTKAPVDNSLTQAQKDAIIKADADKPLGIDPASIPVPAAVKAAFGEKASANLVRDALTFQAATESFHQLQTVPLGATPATIATGINFQLGPLTTPETLNSILKENASPDGSSLLAGFSADQATNGLLVGNKRYHAIGQGIFLSHGKPVVALSQQTTPVTANGQTIQMRDAYVAIRVDTTVPTKEGTVYAAQNFYYNLIPTPDGHWLVAGYRVVGAPLSTTPIAVVAGG